MPTHKSFTAQVIVESTDGDLERLGRAAVEAVKRSCHHLRNAVVVIGVYDDDNDELLGLDVHGSPSEEMRVHINELFGDEQPK